MHMPFMYLISIDVHKKLILQKILKFMSSRSEILQIDRI